MSDATKVVKCMCEHDFQDQTYGKKNRVFNVYTEKKSGNKVGQGKCTVCGVIKDMPKR